MKWTLEQWNGFSSQAIADQSRAAIFHVLENAKADIFEIAADRDKMKEINAELMEALIGAIEHWPVPSSICKDRAAYEAARAAIDKATGESK